jgi:hypothetical protein
MSLTASATALHFQAHLGNVDNCAAILDDDTGAPVDVDCKEAGVSAIPGRFSTDPN